MMAVLPLSFSHPSPYENISIFILVSTAFAVFSFTCVIDLVSALQHDGWITGFMEFYQKAVSIYNAFFCVPSFIRAPFFKDLSGLIALLTVPFLHLQGEPYLGTAYGIMMCYWDGIVHFILYLFMICRITER